MRSICGTNKPNSQHPPGVIAVTLVDDNLHYVHPKLIADRAVVGVDTSSSAEIVADPPQKFMEDGASMDARTATNCYRRGRPAYRHDILSEEEASMRSSEELPSPSVSATA